MQEESPSYAYSEWEKIREAFRGHLTGPGYAPSTVTMYADIVKYLARYLEEERRPLGPHQVTRPLIERYIGWMRGRGQALSTVERRVGALRVFFSWLAEERRILISPMEGIVIRGVHDSLPLPVPTEREVTCFLEAPDLTTRIGVRNHTMLELLYGTGIRKGELVSISLEDLDIERGLLVVRQGKGRKDRVVPLGKQTARWLRRYLQDIRPRLQEEGSPDRLFLVKGGGPMTGGALQGVFWSLQKKTGIKITPHALRRAFATHMIRRGANPMHVKDLLGHADLSTIRRYVKLVARDLKKTHEACHPREVQSPKTKVQSPRKGAVMDGVAESGTRGKMPPKEVE